MMYAENKKYRLEIDQDDCDASPREWDNLGIMICFHKRYALGDKHDINPCDFSSWDEIEGHLVNQGYIAVTRLFLFDHSGITISTKPFHCPWDSGPVGFICTTREKIKKSFGKKRLTKKLLTKIQAILDSEVEVYDQFITGEVYRFILFDKKTGEEDCCSGFYGNDWQSNGIKDHLPEKAWKLLEVLEDGC